MIEVSKVHYDVIAITEKKVQLNITQIWQRTKAVRD